MDSLNLPLIPNLACSSKEEALNSPTGNLRLVEDLNYKFIFNDLFEEIEYSHNYETEDIDIKSPAFLNHINEMALKIKEEVDLDAKIIEIGCGKGYFVELLENVGFTNCFGFDTTYEGNKKNFEKRYFEDKDFNCKADCIILRHTLEHIPSPQDFLKKIIHINNNEKCKIFIEVPCFDWILENSAYWDLTIEHCNYFTKKFFDNIFPGCKVEKVFDDQFIFVSSDVSNFKFLNKENKSDPINLKKFFQT